MGETICTTFIFFFFFRKRKKQMWGKKRGSIPPFFASVFAFFFKIEQCEMGFNLPLGHNYIQKREMISIVYVYECLGFCFVS